VRLTNAAIHSMIGAIGPVGQAYLASIHLQRAYEAEMPMGDVQSYNMDIQFKPLTSTYSCGILKLASKIRTPLPITSIKNMIV
jgi:hypothetical protein